MFGLFFRKKEINNIKEETKKSFEHVKKDIAVVSGWIKHLDSEKNLQKRELEEVRMILSSIKEEMEELKNFTSIIEKMFPAKMFKTPKKMFNKQTAVYDVQTPVYTAVQTPKFDNFSITERAILGVLLYTDMKLSYEDLATMLGKEKSTIRGQINRIKQKSEGLVEEITEKGGKKRVFIPSDMKEKMLKKLKVRVGGDKEKEKN